MPDLSFLDSLTPEQAAALLTDVVGPAQEKRRCEESLAEFVKCGWHVLEPSTPLVWNWHLDTLCAYLEALYYGKIKRLIVNIPPGTMKSLVASVFFEAWIWTIDPGYRFLCGSNEGTLATRDSLRMRQLVESGWYQRHWGDRVQMSKDQAEKTLFTNTARGHRESQGVLGKVTGKRGDMLVWDDPHDTKQTDSDVIRQGVLDAYDNAWSSRRNNLATSPILVIMQRIHDNDITAHLMRKAQGWVRLAIPMRYDSEVTFDAGKDIGRPDLNDPRKVEGELMFPARFPEEAVRDLEEDLGAYGTAGQLQQRPSPKGGGEFKKAWVCYWRTPPKGGNRYIIVDPAGERKPGVKGKRDNTAIGVIELCADGNYYLIDGVRDRLNLEERTKLLFKWHRQYKPVGVGYEQYGMQTDIAHIKSKMEEESYRFRVIELGGSMRKEDRIRRLIPLFSRGKFWLPETLHRTNVEGKTVDIIDLFIEQEYLRFPVAKFDDFFDMLSRILDPDMEAVAPEPPPPPVTVRPMRNHMGM